MTFSAYMRYALWEFLLVFGISVALAYTLMDGFYIAPELQYSPLPAVIVGLVLIFLYLIAFNRKSVRIGAPLFAIAVFAGLAVSVAVSDAGMLDDTESSYFLFAFISIVVPLLAFLLARRRGGAAVLFIAGAFICAFIQFFYGRYELLWMFVFLGCSLALIVYKNYQLSARTATTVGRLSFSAGFGVAAAAVVVAVGLGSALWFGVIAPLGPDALEIKLITEVRALETQQVKGSSNEFLTPRMDLTSNTVNDDERTTDDLKQSEDGRPEPARPRDETQVEEQESGSLMGLDIDSVVEAFDFESNANTAWLITGILLLVPILIAAYFIGRRLYRSHRLKVFGRMEPSRQVQELYRFFVGKLQKVGFALPAGSTVLEFARSTQGPMERMDNATGASFSSLTDVYANVVYGKQAPSEDQVQLFHRYYEGFWKAARAQLGNVKYFFKSFRL